MGLSHWVRRFPSEPCSTPPEGSQSNTIDPMKLSLLSVKSPCSYGFPRFSHDWMDDNMTIWHYPCCWTPFKHGWWVQRFNSCRKVENVPRRHFGQQLYLLQGRWREGVSSDGRNPMCIGNELQFIQPIYIWLVVWNIFYFCPYIGNNHPNWPIYFSEG